MLIARRFGFSSVPSEDLIARRSGAQTRACSDCPTSSPRERDTHATAHTLDLYLEIVESRREAKALIAARVATGEAVPSMSEALREVGGDSLTLRTVRDSHLMDRMRRAQTATDTLKERLVWFWSNHLAVSRAGGGPRRVLAGPYEIEVIRPHVDGRFEDMLLAAVHHSAMLRYLDGRASVGPNSQVGQRTARGLNENLAREILELHTLGVDGGYDQADVEGLAKILTGWQCRSLASDQPGMFVFAKARHEPGPQKLLGKTYADDGYEQGLAALRDLACHPSTARHLSWKLGRHFIADDPPERLVRELTTVFLEADGDLGAVTDALVRSPEAAEAPHSKLRLPQEFLVAMLRAANVELEPRLLDRMCRVMGQPVWEPPGPDGFPDTVVHWLSPEGMKRRLDVAMAVAERADPTLDPLAVMDVAVGDAASDDTKFAVERAESRQQALALLFMSPEFQWR